MSDLRYITVARVMRAHGVKGELSCEIVTDYPERFAKTERVFLAPNPGRPPGQGKQKPKRARARSDRAPVTSTEIEPGVAATSAANLTTTAERTTDEQPPLDRTTAGHAIARQPTDAPSPTSSAEPPPREYVVSKARVVPHSRGATLVLQLAGIEDRDAADALRDWLVQVPENEAWTLPKGRYYWHQIIGLAVVTLDGRRLGAVADILETGANDVYVVSREGGDLLLPAIKDVVKCISPERGEMVVELLPGME